MARTYDDLRSVRVHPHTVELFLSSPLTRRAFSFLLNRQEGDRTYLEKVLLHYAGEEVRFNPSERFYYLLLYSFIGLVLKALGVNRHFIQQEISKEPLYLKVIPLILESVARFGLTRPQNFISPLLVVWNFTNACNLRCKHCYQNAWKRLPDELSLEERLDVIDQLDRMNLPLLAFSGGEPLVDREIWRIIEYARSKGIWLSLATNGTLITEEVARRLKEAGINYVEVSVDSAEGAKHDSFRGVPGYWRKTIQGIRNCVKAGLPVGFAPTVSRFNYAELDDLYELACELGAERFYPFNFIPTGRAKQISKWDISCWEREEVLKKLHGYMLEERISVMSTMPQFARACIQYAPKGPLPTSHYSTGIGVAAVYASRYIGGCGAGRAYCALQPNGKITPCVFIGDLVVGDIRQRSFRDIWLNSEIFAVLRDRDNLKDNCHSCDFRDFCGGCRARAYGYFGDITAPDPGCINNSKAWEELKNWA
ncbi:MAG TPA: radical SAM protein [Candidatus Latescibacteria bacterium]|nr:radical SAM protein [Candidatus Latescibacterota bacterium]